MTEQGVAGEQLCLPCAFRAGGVAGALTVLTLGVGRVPAVQRFAGRIGTWLGETRLGQWAAARLTAAAERVGLRRVTPAAAAASTVDRPLFAPKPPPGTLEPGALPGVAREAFNDAPPLPPDFPPSYDLSTPRARDALNSFAGAPRPDRLASGTRLYRVIDADSNPAGGFWSLEPPPATEAEWRAGWAVQGKWNGDGAYVESVVGDEGLPVWRGPAAAQKTADDAWHLLGGREQIFVPPNTIAASPPLRTPWNP